MYRLRLSILEKIAHASVNVSMYLHNNYLTAHWCRLRLLPQTRHGGFWNNNITERSPVRFFSAQHRAILDTTSEFKKLTVPARNEDMRPGRHQCLCLYCKSAWHLSCRKCKLFEAPTKHEYYINSDLQRRPQKMFESRPIEINLNARMKARAFRQNSK